MITVRQFPDEDYYVTDGTTAIYVFAGAGPGNDWYITGSPFEHLPERCAKADRIVPLQQAVQEIPIPFLHVFHPRSMF